jgi:hypothetical protein
MPRPFLSVVVVLYEMKRAARRALHALSAAYQQGIDEWEYEVHVVENGSKTPVGEAFVRSFGANFHYHFLQDGLPSPANALNYGVRKSRGRYVALMIDGAHILTPGVFSWARHAVRAFRSPVIGPQPNTIAEGYDAQTEDRLLTQIGWPDEPYRLFEIATPMDGTTANWFGKFTETNCLIMPRRLYKTIGGSDERFHLPGGGLLNLDTFSRSLEIPGTRLIALLGEGSFHQVHGGVMTNVVADEAERLRRNYGEQYRRIRGRPCAPPATASEFFGVLHDHSLLV